MKRKVRAYLGLGSNLGDRSANIESGLAKLRSAQEIELVTISQIIETAPIGPPDQPQYLNAAVEVSTTLPPRALLDTCLAIEGEHGRLRSRERRWGPRTLDIDLLLYGDMVIDEPGLVVPHPRMAERGFVLIPLSEVAPNLVHPVLGVTIKELRSRLMSETARE